jgi:hypothetical protein
MSVDLPAADGAVVARALDRLAQRVPVLPPEEDGPWGIEARRADALVAMASARMASDPDPDRATVIVHARVDEAVPGRGWGPFAGEPHSARARRGSPRAP